MNTPWGLPKTLGAGYEPLRQTAPPGDKSQQPRFVLTEIGTRVYAVGASEPFPSRRVSHNGFSLRVTELPGPALDGDKAHKDNFELRANSGAVDNIQVTYKVQRTSLGAHEDNGFRSLETVFDQVLDEMVFITCNILKIERSKVDAVFWHDVLGALKREYSLDPAKHALITELAEFIVPAIERIAASPKKTLRRIRDHERVQSVRELDKHCLIDLARRPGASLPEKAGPRQRVLSIKRHESVDTLENQVFLHCCDMLALASKRYLSIHRGISGSNRKSLVETLARCGGRMNKAPALRGVSRLRSPCRQPNYVLLQNAHYAKIWKAYTQLIRNEQLRDILWRWSRRLFTNYLTFYLADTIVHWFKSTRALIAVPIAEKVVQAQTRQQSGSWLLPDVLPGPLVLGTSDDNTGTFYAIDGASCGALGDFAEPLSLLNADFLLVWLTAGEQAVLPIYVNTCDGCEAPDAVVSKTEACVLNSAAAFNKAHQDWRCIGGWVFHDSQNVGEMVGVDSENGGHITCWQTSMKTGASGWRTLSTERFAPLSNLTGFKAHGTRN